MRENIFRNCEIVITPGPDADGGIEIRKVSLWIDLEPDSDKPERRSILLVDGSDELICSHHDALVRVLESKHRKEHESHMRSKAADQYEELQR